MKSKKQRALCLSLAVCLIFSSLTIPMKVSADTVSSTITLPDKNVYDIVKSESRPSDSISYVTSATDNMITTPYTNEQTAEAIIVNNIVVGKGNPNKGTYVPPNGLVITGTGTKRDLIYNLNIGDAVSLSGVQLPSFEQNYIEFKNSNNTISRKNITGKNTSRGAEQIIIYTPEFGESTKTNPWGVEITVVNNKITNITSSGTGGNAPIPKNGYVVSINGETANTDYGHLKIGDDFTIKLEITKYYDVTTLKYNAFNPKQREDNPAGWDEANNKPYGGFRGADQLIVYDVLYGKATTETNVWGAEVTVDKKSGRIVSSQGGNSVIKEGQFVLSGHGIMVTALNGIDKSSARVSFNIDKKEVVIIRTPTMIIDTINDDVTNALKSCENAKKSLVDVDYEKLKVIVEGLKAVQSEIPSLKTYIDDLDFKGLSEKAKEIDVVVNNAYNAIVPGLRIEKRCVWYRPVETNEQAVRATLQYVKDAGFNTIYLESWIEGHTIWPSNIQGVEMYPSLNGFDAMKAFTTIGKELGIEIHAWVETFFVGAFPKGNPPSYSLPAQHPEWLLKSRFGDNCLFVDAYNVNFYFFNPMEQGVRDLVSNVYKELISKYDIAGVNFDYVRFPEANGRNEAGIINDFGYNENIVNAYKAKYGTDPYKINENHKEWKQWCHFRAEFINTFVYRATSELKAMDKNLKISASVISDYEEAPLKKYQETLDWVSKGYIDEIFTMSYYLDAKPVVDDAVLSKQKINNMSYSSTGIGAFMGLQFNTISSQLAAIRNQNTASSAIFSLHDIRVNNMGPKFKDSIYKTQSDAMPEDIDKSIVAILNNIKRKISEIFVTQTTDKLTSYPVEAINTVIENLSKSNYTVAETKDHIQSINGLFTKVTNSNINGEAKNIIIKDLERCIYLLNVHVNRQKFLDEQSIYSLAIEYDSKNAKTNENAGFRVRATINHPNYVSIMYLNPDQYEITALTNNVEFSSNTSMNFKDKKNAVIKIKVTDKFKLGTIPQSRSFTFNTNFENCIPADYPDYLNNHVILHPTPNPVEPEKPTQTIPTQKVIDKLLDSANNGVSVDLTKPDIISKDIVKAAKEQNKIVTFNIVDSNGKLQYSWIIDGKNVNDIKDINLELKVSEMKANSNIPKAANNENGLVLSFSHSGSLPANTQIKVYVGDQFKDGDKLYFYYFNEVKGQLEKIADEIVVKDGYATVTINHCSDYVLTKTEIKVTTPNTKNPQTGDNAPIIPIVTIVLCMGLLVASKKARKISC